MRPIYLRTDFPNGRSHILMKNIETLNKELQHFILVLSNNGKIWVDVFWPYDEEYDKFTYVITEQKFWELFREWRLQGLTLGDNSKVAQILARNQLNKKKKEYKI